MASASSGTPPTPTDALTTQQGGNTQVSRAAPEELPSPAAQMRRAQHHRARSGHRAREPRGVVEAALAAIEAANKSPAWKARPRSKAQVQPWPSTVAIPTCAHYESHRVCVQPMSTASCWPGRCAAVAWQQLVCIGLLPLRDKVRSHALEPRIAHASLLTVYPLPTHRWPL